jgi:UDP-N-acetylmuramate: L-alanyl-gamma-D-glutamyl-meso-diaminopimelate ligase
MGSLAAMLKAKGYRITGSDSHIYPPMSEILAGAGIAVEEGFDAAHLITPSPNLVVIGNAVSRGNPEVEETLKRKIRYASLPEVLREVFIRGNTSVVVTGTHGKTTTAALIAHLLMEAGRDPGFLIGGVPRNFEVSYRLGGGGIFVVEGDEYDTAFFDKGPKFLHYLPDTVVINNIEFDHADIYRNLEEIKTSFRRLITIIPGNGLLIANGEDRSVVDLLHTSALPGRSTTLFCPVETFGNEGDAVWQGANIVFSCSGTSFRILHRCCAFSDVTIPLTGRHNVMNALAAVAVTHYLGLSAEEIRSGLSTFKGVRRRLELRGTVSGIAVYDDFAHHPTAVRETLAGFRAIHPDERVWAIFEPGSATNARAIFEDDYVTAFHDADFVIFGRIPRPERAGTDPPMSIERIVERMRDSGRSAWYLPEVDGIIRHIVTSARPGDQVIIMSNSGFENIHARLLKALTP